MGVGWRVKLLSLDKSRFGRADAPQILLTVAGGNREAEPP